MRNVLIVIAVMVAAVMADYHDTIFSQNTSLLSYYTSRIADDNAYDSIGNYNATNASSVSQGDGIVEKYLHYDMDGGSYLDCGRMNELEGARQVTFSMIFRVDTQTVSAVNNVFVSKGSASGSFFQSYINYSQSTQLMRTFIYSIGCYVTATCSFQADQWHHVAYVYDFDQANDTNKVRMYFDGLLCAGWTKSAALPDTLVVSADNFRIGETQYLGWDMRGDIDEVAVWTRALTAAEILSQANAVTPLSLSVPYSNFQVLQHDSGLTNRMIYFNGHFSIPTKAEKIAVQLLTYDTDSTITDWTIIDSSLTALAGNYSDSIRAPFTRHWTKLRTRLIDTSGAVICTSATSSTKFGVGYIFNCIGQSNMQGRGNSPYTISNKCVSMFSYNLKTWDSLIDPVGTMNTSAGGSMLPKLGNILSQYLNAPVGFTMYAKGSTALVGGDSTFWVYRSAADSTDTLSGGWYGKNLNNVFLADSQNGVDGIIILQGESDVVNCISYSAYKDSLSQLITNYRNDLPGTPDFYIVQIGHRTAGSDCGDTSWYNIRRAQLDLNNPDNGIYFAASTYDQGLTDGIHFTSRGQDTIAMRVSNTILYSRGISSFYRGPRLDTMEIYNDNIKVYTITNGTITPATGATGFLCRKISDGLYIAPDSVSISDTIITLYVPEKCDSVSYIYGANPVVTASVRDSIFAAEPFFGLGSSSDDNNQRSRVMSRRRSSDVKIPLTQ